MKLEDKVAIVTAAGRGLGRGIALALAKEGADVVVNSYREETTEAVADEIKAMSRRCLAIPGDITKPEKIIQVLEETIDTFGRMDILVNNVGSGSKTPKEPGSGPLGQIIATWDTTYEQNLRATVLMCEAVSPHFIEKGDGKIVNISSIAGRYAAYVNVLENIARAVVFLASEDSKNITGQSINVDGGMIKT